MMRRMKVPHDSFVDSRDFARIARAIRFIATNFRAQPRLAEIAAQAGLSEFHFNRLFRRWAGLTPKQYLAFVTGREAKGELTSQPSVLEAAYAVGLSGPGRLHDLIVSLDAVTPGELKALGLGVEIRYGFADTPFGRALLATTPRGLCHLAFVEPGEDQKAVIELRDSWRNADFARDDARATDLAQRVWSPTGPAAAPLKLNVVATNFQLKVWQALLDLGAHRRTTYTALADAIGQAGSARAVGNAVGANPVGWLIPCHNVLRRDGTLGGYHWGEDRKRAILAWDSLSRQREEGGIDVPAVRHAT
jgi:AraC family transcriptional regulator, regulatory protein of adaptative response / methylated-DNA-[protein]-cysteine methyltransferase